MQCFICQHLSCWLGKHGNTAASCLLPLSPLPHQVATQVQELQLQRSFHVQSP